MSLLHELPHSTESEQAVLAAMLIEPKTVNKVQRRLDPSDFFHEHHAIIAEAVFKVGSDLQSVTDEIDKRGLSPRAKTPEYLFDLAQTPILTSSIERWIGIILEASKTRKIIEVCSKAISSAQDHSSSSDILAILTNDILKLQSQGIDESRQDQGSLLIRWHDRFYDQIERGDFRVGPLCGLSAIDNWLYGFEPKGLYFVAARPSMGKTALLVEMIRHMAHEYPGRVLFYSIEMSDLEITSRMVSSVTGVPLGRIRTGRVSDEDQDKVQEALNQIGDYRLVIRDQSKFSKVEILVGDAKAKAIDGPLTAVFVDHIQLMKTGRRTNTRHEEIGSISKELKGLAKDLDVPVIVACQIRREVENRRDTRPRLSDLKESGDLEQDADGVIGLHRHSGDSTEMEVLGLKGRNAGTSRGLLHFDPITQRITDVEKSQSEKHWQLRVDEKSGFSLK